MVFEKILLSIGDEADTVATDSTQSGFVCYPAVLFSSLTAEERERQQEIYQRAYAQAHAAMAREHGGNSERIVAASPAWRN